MHLLRVLQRRDHYSPAKLHTRASPLCSPDAPSPPPAGPEPRGTLFTGCGGNVVTVLEPQQGPRGSPSVRHYPGSTRLRELQQELLSAAPCRCEPTLLSGKVVFHAEEKPTALPLLHTPSQLTPRVTIGPLCTSPRKEPGSTAGRRKPQLGAQRPLGGLLARYVPTIRMNGLKLLETKKLGVQCDERPVSEHTHQVQNHTTVLRPRTAT